MHTIYSKNTDIRNKKALDICLRFIRSQKNRETIIIGLSGGTSLLGFYSALTQAFPSLEKSLQQKIRFVFLDERLMPKGHRDRNDKSLRTPMFQELIDKGCITEEQILTVDETLKNPADRYFSRVPHIDIGLFGVGPDGHIGSLFPHHPGLSDNSLGYIQVDDSPKPPSKRISVSRKFLSGIPLAFLFFIGESKKDAYENFLNPTINNEDCPAKYLLNNGELIVVTDIVMHDDIRYSFGSARPDTPAPKE